MTLPVKRSRETTSTLDNEQEGSSSKKIKITEEDYDFPESVVDEDKVKDYEETILDNDKMKIILYRAFNEDYEPGLVRLRAKLFLKQKDDKAKPEVLAAKLSAQMVDTLSEEYTFYEICDAKSQALYDVGHKLCLENGDIRPEIISALGITDDEHKYLQFDVLHRFRGNALGLQLISAVLNYHTYEIKLVGLFATYYPSNRTLRDDLLYYETMDEKQVRDDRLYQYYYRLEGFKQVSRETPAFFARSNYECLDGVQKVLSREEAAKDSTVFPWIRPPKALEGVDRELSLSITDPVAVLKLLRKGADPVEVNALQLAAKGESIETVCVLLAHGVDINDRGKRFYGSTALHFAAAKKHVEMVKLLIELGADTHLQDYSGSTALDKAIVNERGLVALASMHCNTGITEDYIQEWEDLKKLLK